MCTSDDLPEVLQVPLMFGKESEVHSPTPSPRHHTLFAISADGRLVRTADDVT